MNHQPTPIADFELEPVICDACTLVPLSHLALDGLAPGWVRRREDIEVVRDDLGRDAINRDDARRLLTERDEEAAKRAEQVRRRAAAAPKRRVLPGKPTPEGIGSDLTAFEVMRAGEPEDPKRVSPLHEFLGVQRFDIEGQR